MTDHGTRSTYVAGCHCPACCAANTRYFQHLRRLKLHGTMPMGVLISPAEALKHLRRFQIERYSKRQLAGHLSLDRSTLTITPDRLCRLRTLLKLRRGSRILIQEGPQDSPNV